MTYSIFEGNMERLRQKMTRIENKCQRYGCEFHFAEVGEEYRDYTDPDTLETKTLRFIIVEAEGKAIINDWQFVASLEHTEKGNVIQKAVDVEVPARYYNSKPVCEHCGTNRVRKNTYIVRNTKTGEFKQVGRSCLCDFTNGMSAEGVAAYIAAFDELIKGEAPDTSGEYEGYYNTAEFLRYTAETIRHFGYTKSDKWEDGGVRSTSSRVSDYYGYDHGWFSSPLLEGYRKRIRAEMDSVGFDAESKEAAEMVQKALAWLETQSEDNNYMHNLKTACALKYIPCKLFGVVVSLFPTYDREYNKEVERKAKAAAESSSEYQGEIGDRLTVEIAEMICVTGWDSQFGYTRIWKIKDASGNVYTWKTTKDVDPEKIKTITGTVKEHKVFREVKQTELTRCKVA